MSIRHQKVLLSHWSEFRGQAQFSESDREALGWAWKTFGRIARFDLAKLTHEYPEWKGHEAALQARLVSRAPMNYRDFLDDPPKKYDPCHPLTQETREAVAEGIGEMASFERSWS